MNIALSSYTPRVKPLHYDALLNNLGCQSIEGGLSLFGFRELVQACIKTPADGFYDQPDTVSYAVGPSQIGGSHPFSTTWAAWVASAGIRIGKLSQVTPPADTLGQVSPIVAADKPTKLSLAFLSNGRPVIATQKTASTIEITISATPNVVTQFSGVSAVLVYGGQFQHASEMGVACYYIDPESPDRLFARFSGEGFATEHRVAPLLPVAITRLVGVSASGDSMLLEGRDDTGRIVSIYSADYNETTAEKSKIGIGLTSGTYFNTAHPAESLFDKSKCELSLTSGMIFDPRITSILPFEKHALSLSLTSGECRTA